MKRKRLTEEAVLAIIDRKGEFQINPLRWRETGRMKLLRRMERNGLLVCVVRKIDDVAFVDPRSARTFLDKYREHHPLAVSAYEKAVERFAGRPPALAMPYGPATSAAAVLRVVQMALQHIRICAPDPVVEAHLESVRPVDLQEIAGHFEDGSAQRLVVYPDDATRTWGVIVGDEMVGSGKSVWGALADAAKHVEEPK